MLWAKSLRVSWNFRYLGVHISPGLHSPLFQSPPQAMALTTSNLTVFDTKLEKTTEIFLMVILSYPVTNSTFWSYTPIAKKDHWHDWELLTVLLSLWLNSGELTLNFEYIL